MSLHSFFANIRRAGVVAVVATLLAVFTASPALSLSFNRDPNNSTNIFVWGNITLEDPATLRAFLTANPEINTLTMSSPGGSVAAGIALARMVEYHQLSVVLTDTSGCHSACTFLLLASPSPTVSPNALIGFHASFRTPPDGGRILYSADDQRFLYDMYARYGLPDFINVMAFANHNDDMLIISGRTLSQLVPRIQSTTVPPPLPQSLRQ